MTINKFKVDENFEKAKKQSQHMRTSKTGKVFSAGKGSNVSNNPGAPDDIHGIAPNKETYEEMASKVPNIGDSVVITNGRFKNQQGEVIKMGTLGNDYTVELQSGTKAIVFHGDIKKAPPTAQEQYNSARRSVFEFLELHGVGYGEADLGMIGDINETMSLGLSLAEKERMVKQYNEKSNDETRKKEIKHWLSIKSGRNKDVFFNTEERLNQAVDEIAKDPNDIEVAIESHLDSRKRNMIGKNDNGHIMDFIKEKEASSIVKEIKNFNFLNRFRTKEGFVHIVSHTDVKEIGVKTQQETRLDTLLETFDGKLQRTNSNIIGEVLI
jgi:hypothetical protein